MPNQQDGLIVVPKKFQP